jgi:hypothetical protein
MLIAGAIEGGIGTDLCEHYPPIKRIMFLNKKKRKKEIRVRPSLIFKRFGLETETR